MYRLLGNFIIQSDWAWCKVGERRPIWNSISWTVITMMNNNPDMHQTLSIVDL